MIYRLNEVQKPEGMVGSFAKSCWLSAFPMGPTIKDEFPEVKNFTRIRWQDEYQMTYGDKRIYLPTTYFVDTSFLSIFDFPLIRGDRQEVLQKPNSAVLTASTAKKLFGDQDPIGRTISHFAGDTLLFTVRGVMADVPENSQFRFDALFSFNTIIRPEWVDMWGRNWMDTYFAKTQA